MLVYWWWIGRSITNLFWNIRLKAWTVIEIFTDRYANTSNYQLPLIHGSPKPEWIKQMQTESLTQWLSKNTRTKKVRSNVVHARCWERVTRVYWICWYMLTRSGQWRLWIWEVWKEHNMMVRSMQYSIRGKTRGGSAMYFWCIFDYTSGVNDNLGGRKASEGENTPPDKSSARWMPLDVLNFIEW